MVSYVTPVLALAAGVIARKEQIRSYTVVGAVLILAGSATVSWLNKRQDAR
jgi:drug/metabolite transporter (DMT)-like permease